MKGRAEPEGAVRGAGGEPVPRILRREAFPVAVALFFLMAGCATVAVDKVPPQPDILPSRTDPDAPLVLAIPGLRIRGLGVPQERQFGRLPEMLASRGIPCRILTYDTSENPLPEDAALFSPGLAIAWTRVGPAVVQELEYEDDRRASLGLPPVAKIAFIGYSQGGVIMEQLARRVFYNLRNDYEKMRRTFGAEWDALRRDPEFKYFIDALDDFLVIKNIRIQRKREFERSPDLRSFYERAEAKARRRFHELAAYLVDPSSRYPGVKEFEGPESPKYPKRYGRVKLCASSLEHCSLEQRERIMRFFVDYAEYRNLLDVSPYFMTLSASFFGSPRASEALRIFRWFPILKLFTGPELNQIRETMLGTERQRERIDYLVRLSRDARYPVEVENALFVVGANGARGDGLVDQSSAHLSNHAYSRIRAAREPASGRLLRFESVEHERLPDLMVAPVGVRHFPEKILWGLGGERYGSAYMVEGNPVYPFILAFVSGDWSAVRSTLLDCGISLRQFMLQVSFTDAPLGPRSVRRLGQSDNVKIDGRYYNSEAGTVVFTGHFKGRDEVMNLCGEENVAGSVELLVRLARKEEAPLTCKVYPGCNSFVRIETGAPGLRGRTASG